MENHLNDFILKSIKYFDKQNKKYSNYLNKTKLILTNNDKTCQIINIKTGETIKIKCNYEILGVFDHNSNVFLWGWSLPYLSLNETKISKELLNYGLKLEPSSNTISHFFLKSLLVNARNNIETDFDLDLIQAICSYILKDKCDFIYPLDLNDNNNNKIMTSYILIKIVNN